VIGTGVWCFNGAQKKDETTLVGTHGSLTFSTFDTRPFSHTTAGGTEETQMDYPQHVQQPLIQSIVNELNGQGQCVSTGESGARTTWVMDQLLHSYYQESE
jgi:hypothetical protein